MYVVRIVIYTWIVHMHVKVTNAGKRKSMKRRSYDETFDPKRKHALSPKHMKRMTTKKAFERMSSVVGNVIDNDEEDELDDEDKDEEEAEMETKQKKKSKQQSKLRAHLHSGSGSDEGDGDDTTKRRHNYKRHSHNQIQMKLQQPSSQVVQMPFQTGHFMYNILPPTQVPPSPSEYRSAVQTYNMQLPPMSPPFVSIGYKRDY